MSVNRNVGMNFFFFPSSVLSFQNPFGSAERWRVQDVGAVCKGRDLRDAQSRTVRLEVFCRDASVCNSIVTPRNVSESSPLER